MGMFSEPKRLNYVFKEELQGKQFSLLDGDLDCRPPFFGSEIEL
jgi:hypothetical protein